MIGSVDIANPGPLASSNFQALGLPALMLAPLVYRP